MKLNCGCEMWREGKTFYVKPCGENCEFYLYAIEQSKEKGLTVAFRGLENLK